MYEQLKALINQYIKTNGIRQITGAVLNNVLNEMVNSLGGASGYGGIITPTSQTPANDANIFYIAIQEGNYTNFGITVNAHELAFVKRSGNGWAKDGVPLGSGIVANPQGTPTGQLEKIEIDGVIYTNPQGPAGQDAYQPFKGTFATQAALEAAYPTPNAGDTAYVEATVNGNDVLEVWDVVSGAWNNTHRTADSPQFASGEFLNTVNIDKTHLVNPVSGALANAEDVANVTNGTTQSKEKNLLSDATDRPMSMLSDKIFINPDSQYRAYEIKLPNVKDKKTKIFIKATSITNSSTYFFVTKKKIPSLATNNEIDGSTIASEYAAECNTPTGTSAYRHGLLPNVTYEFYLSDDAVYIYVMEHYSDGIDMTPQILKACCYWNVGGLNGRLENVENINPIGVNLKNAALQVDTSNVRLLSYQGTNQVVYEGLSLTEIFEKNNSIPIYPGFDNGSYAEMVVGNGDPKLTTTEKVTGKYSLFINDVDATSSQMKYPALGNFGVSGENYYAAAKVKVTSYTQGKIGINASSYDTGQVYLQRITDGWETISKIFTTVGGSPLFVGGFTSSKLVGYIDSPVLVNMAIFFEAPTVEQLNSWYELYITYKLTESEILLRTEGNSVYEDSTCMTRFIQEMNARAGRIGMEDTIFTTASGLDTTLNANKSTARDMIKLIIEAMSHPRLMKVWGKPSWTLKYYDASASADATKTLESTVCNPNHNADLATLLQSYNILGGKTGTIGGGQLPIGSNKYYHNYCVIAEKNGKYVIAVLFGGDYVGTTYGDKRYAKMKILLDNAFGLLNDPSYVTATVLDKPSQDYLCSCAAIEVPKIEPSILQDFSPTILYEESGDLQVYIASTTKIMTCLLADELIDVHQKLLYKSIDDVGGSGDDLDNGDIADFENMMMDTMLPSSNGCAECIGRIAGRVLLQYDNGMTM